MTWRNMHGPLLLNEAIDNYIKRNETMNFTTETMVTLMHKALRKAEQHSEVNFLVAVKPYDSYTVLHFIVVARLTDIQMLSKFLLTSTKTCQNFWNHSNKILLKTITPAKRGVYLFMNQILPASRIK